MSVTANIRLDVSGKQESALDLGTAALPFGLNVEAALTNGVAAGMADRAFTDTRTLAASATENLDIAASLVDAFGATIAFAKIKAVIIRAAAANVNDVQVTRPATLGVPLFLAAGDGLAIKPGYAFAFFGTGAGITVTPDTGDLLTITNSGGTTGVTYDVIIIGTSA
jgi:hypothetical protein